MFYSFFWYTATNLNPTIEAITDLGMHLIWDPNTNNQLQKYTITVVDTNGNSVISEDIPPGETSYTFPNLPASGAIYEYILNAYFGGASTYAGSVQEPTSKFLKCHYLFTNKIAVKEKKCHYIAC